MGGDALRPRLLRGLPTAAPVDVATSDAGPAPAERYGPSLCDATSVPTAPRARCDTLWSEDMRHGMAPEGGLRIADPFRSAERS